MIEQFPIQPEELLPEETYRVEVFYEEPQEFDTFDKKGKDHEHGKGGGHKKDKKDTYRGSDEYIKEQVAMRTRLTLGGYPKEGDGELPPPYLDPNDFYTTGD